MKTSKQYKLQDSWFGFSPNSFDHLDQVYEHLESEEKRLKVKHAEGNMTDANLRYWLSREYTIIEVVTIEHQIGGVFNVGKVDSKNQEKEQS